MLSPKAILLCILLSKIHAAPPIDRPKFYDETIDLLENGPIEIGPYLSTVDENWLEEFEPANAQAATQQTHDSTTISPQSSQQVLPQPNSEGSSNPFLMAMEPESPDWHFDGSQLEEALDRINAGKAGDNHLQTYVTPGALSTLPEGSNSWSESGANLPIPVKAPTVDPTNLLSQRINPNDAMSPSSAQPSSEVDKDSATQVIPGQNTEISEGMRNMDEKNENDATENPNDPLTEIIEDPLLKDFMDENSDLINDKSIWSVIVDGLNSLQSDTHKPPVDSTSSEPESTQDGSVTGDKNEAINVQLNQMLKPLQTVSTSSRPTEQAQSVGYVPNSVKTIIDPGLTSQTTGHEALIDNLLLDKSSTMGDILPGVNSGISSGISETQQIPTEPQPESETSGPPEETTQNDMPELTAGATSLDDGSSVAPKKPKRKRQRKPKINVPKDTQVQGTEGLLSGTKIVDESSTSENIAAQPTSRKGRKRTTKTQSADQSQSATNQAATTETNEKNDEPRPLTHRQRINALAAEAVTLNLHIDKDAPIPDPTRRNILLDAFGQYSRRTLRERQRATLRRQNKRDPGSQNELDPTEGDNGSIDDNTQQTNVPIASSSSVEQGLNKPGPSNIQSTSKIRLKIIRTESGAGSETSRESGLEASTGSQYRVIPSDYNSATQSSDSQQIQAVETTWPPKADLQEIKSLNLVKRLRKNDPENVQKKRAFNAERQRRLRQKKHEEKGPALERYLESKRASGRKYKLTHKPQNPDELKAKREKQRIYSQRNRIKKKGPVELMEPDDGSQSDEDEKTEGETTSRGAEIGEHDHGGN